MDHTPIIVRNLRQLADVIENRPRLTSYRDIILSLQACLSLVILQAYGEQKKLIVNTAYDFAPNEKSGGML